MKVSTKLGALFLSLILGFSAVAACDTDDAPETESTTTTTTTTTEADPGDSEDTGTPDTDEPSDSDEEPGTDDPSTDGPNVDDLEFATVQWFIASPDQTDKDMVQDHINEYLEEKLNMNVDITFWTGAQFQESMPIRLNAQEDLGIVSFGSQSQMDYVLMAQRGQTMPIDDLLDEYGQGAKALFDEGIWNTMRVDGKIYGIPTLKDNAFIMSMIYNEELAEALELDLDWDFTNWSDPELEDWLMDAKAKRDEKFPGEYDDMPLIWDLGSSPFPYSIAVEQFISNSQLAVANIPAFNHVEGKGEHEVFSLFHTDWYMDYAKQRQRYVANGIMAYDYTDKSEWRQGTGVLGHTGWGYTHLPDHLYSDNWTSRMKVSTEIFTDTGNYHSAGTAIASHTSEPERAMMLLNLVNTDPKLASMLRFGIEGQHYVYDDDGKMTFEGSPRNSDTANRGYFQWYLAPAGNLMIVEAPPSLTGDNNELIENMQRYNDEAERAAHMGFVFDQRAIETQYAACAAVVDKYGPSIARGQYNTEAEIVAAVEAFRTELEQNGIQAILDECQSQLDDWVAAQG